MYSLTYIIIIFFVLAFVSHGNYSFWKIRKHLHILQLNSYFNERYFVWLKKRFWQVFNFKELAPLVALIGIFFQVPLIILIFFSVLYLRLFLLRTKLPEKKPLVLTARASRLFGLNLALLAVVYLVLVLLWWHQGDNWLIFSLVVLVLYNFFIPVWLVATNLLIYPLEQMIQKWYLRDAQKLIQNLPNLKVIGITGSFGKTTTKYVLTEILQHKFNTLKTPGSYNTTMGVTKVIRGNLKPIHDIFVVEMSAKKVGDIKEICDLVKPTYGLITAIGEQHLETFKTLENIIKTKNELIESLPLNGTAFFNMDNSYCYELASGASCRVIGYGLGNDIKLDYKVTDIAIEASGSSFKIIRSRDNAQETFHTKLLGKHNIYNILGAAAIASELGVEFHDMLYPIKQLVAIPHRLELKHVSSDIIFIDDAFNSNPVGSQEALEVLAQITGKRKIIITPGMIELGPKEDEYNEQLGLTIAAVCDYVILVGKLQTKAIQKGLVLANYPEKSLCVAKDFAEAKRHLDQILQTGDVVLFENDLPDNYDE